MTVFPTSVGVFLIRRHAERHRSSVPHVRGGVSTPQPLPVSAPWCSPRPWGCFPRAWHAHLGRSVFPTSVGVFPPSSTGWTSSRSVPHVRGGVSAASNIWLPWRSCSPRPWGCFYWASRIRHATDVFPTSVGVFLDHVRARRGEPGVPHVRGGVSYTTGVFSIQVTCSPRPWGCFSKTTKSQSGSPVFPTSVGVFPTT